MSLIFFLFELRIDYFLLTLQGLTFNFCIYFFYLVVIKVFYPSKKIKIQ